MQLLKKSILQDGKCYEGGILKVDGFINHQMDRKHSLYGYNTHKGIVAHIELYF